ncbi:MAG TPA: AMP-binding protein [Edaphobacter sp.]|nr:AMP-binding protein [Edaphobacter sp.]
MARTHLASLVNEFRRSAAETAVVAHRGNRSYRTTYGQIAQLAGRFAAELSRRDIPAGERVLLWGENSAEWIGTFFGCLLRGVIVVPLDAAGSSGFAVRVIKDVSPKLVIGDAHLLETLSTDIPRLFFSELITQLPAEPDLTISNAVTSETPFQIVFTSGTTSEPKGIVHTHRNVLASLQPIEDEIAKYRRYERWVHPLRFLQTLPLSHVFGQFMGLWIPPLLAAEVHFIEQPEARRMTELIHRERISVLIAVPRVLQLLRAHLLGEFPALTRMLDQAEGISIWRRWWKFRRVHRKLGWKFWAVISGGAALPAETEAFWGKLGFALIQGYGMTETAALVTLNHPFHIRHGTIGKALPGREVRISDKGEILVRGDMLSGASWHGGRMHPREGEWLATGDLAAKDESGDLRFLGRKGDVIVTGSGMNVHPADLEQAMNRQNGVHGCVVVSCNTAGGAEPVAVVLFAGSDADLQIATGNANHQLADYQQIRRVLRWPELQFPYTSTGKLLRREVAQWACSVMQGQHTSDHPAEDSLLALIAEVTGEHVSGANDNARLSEDLHLDSLGRVQLQSTIEQKLGIELDDDAIATAETLGDLRTMMNVSTQAKLAPPQTGNLAASVQVSAEEPEKPETNIYPKWPWSWPAHLLRIGFIEIVMRPIIWLLAKPRVTYKTGTIPDGPLLIIGNHVTAYDGALILYALPRKLRQNVAIAMSGELLLDLRKGRNQGNALHNLLAPAGYWLVTALFNAFPLPRTRGFRRSFEHAGEAMDRGYSVLIFPEGTRSKDAILQPFRQGTGLLAQESRIPVLPVAMAGLGKMMMKGWFRSGRLEIRIGAVIPVEEGIGPAELTSKLEKTIRQLLND